MGQHAIALQVPSGQSGHAIPPNLLVTPQAKARGLCIPPRSPQRPCPLPPCSGQAWCLRGNWQVSGTARKGSRDACCYKDLGALTDTPCFHVKGSKEGTGDIPHEPGGWSQVMAHQSPGNLTREAQLSPRVADREAMTCESSLLVRDRWFTAGATEAFSGRSSSEQRVPQSVLPKRAPSTCRFSCPCSILKSCPRTQTYGLHFPTEDIPAWLQGH